MFLRMFLNGRIAPLTMSGEGVPGDQGGGGGAAPSVLSFDSSKPFVDQLPEKYRADANFRDIKNVEGVLDGFVNAQKMLGDRVALPKDGDEKAAAEFWGKLGRPESADKYQIGKKADGSDYDDTDKAFQKHILPILHKANVTQKQFDTIRPAIDELVVQASGDATRRATEYATAQLDGLRKEWGAGFDENLSDAQAAARHLGGDKLIAELNIVKDGKATGDNAELLRALAKLGKQFREDGVLKGGSQPEGGGMDPAAAKAQIAKLQANEDFKKVWLNKGAIGKVDGKDMTHAEAQAEMTRLYQLANPEAAPG